VPVTSPGSLRSTPTFSLSLPLSLIHLRAYRRERTRAHRRRRGIFQSDASGRNGRPLLRIRVLPFPRQCRRKRWRRAGFIRCWVNDGAERRNDGRSASGNTAFALFFYSRKHYSRLVSVTPRVQNIVRGLHGMKRQAE